MDSFQIESAEPMKLPVLFEDNHLLVVNKPAGWVVQGASPSDTSLIAEAANYLRDKYHKPGNIFVGVVSRLDRVVTGVLPLARTSKAAARLSEQFRERRVKKIYWAIVTGEVPRTSQRLQHWLVRDDKRAKTFCYDRPSDGASEGILSYRVRQKWNQFSLLEIELETGRKHQIRSQLEAIGCPIAGDRKYGSPLTWYDCIALHCLQLTLEHPTIKAPITWQAPLPESWKKLDMPDILDSSLEVYG